MDYDQARHRRSSSSIRSEYASALASPIYTPSPCSSSLELPLAPASQSLPERPAPFASLPTPASLAGLPAELIDHILSYLDPLDFAPLSATSQQLRFHALNDSYWQHFVQENVAIPLKNPGLNSSFRELYIRHHNRWFLTRHRIWYSDHPPYGKLLYARFDPHRSCIEAYQVVAEPGHQQQEILDWNGQQVLYQTFNPRVRLDLNQPSLTLYGDFPDSRRIPLGDEIPMSNSEDDANRIELNFMHTRRSVPEELEWASLWPPLKLPSPGQQRTRNESATGYRSIGYRPDFSSLSTATFRVRQWIEFTRFFPANIHVMGQGRGGGGRVGETINTFATLPEEVYTPTKEKPWQGIWCGDYAGHGVEYVVIMQPDDPQPLPVKAAKAFALWPETDLDMSGAEPDVEHSDEEDEVDDVYDDDTDAISELDIPAPEQITRRPIPPGSEATAAAVARTFRNRKTGQWHTLPTPNPSDTLPHKGRLEAIKLTGDPHVPRGEFTFLVNDMGSEGHVGYTSDPIFYDASSSSSAERVSESVSAMSTIPHGARIVRSCGQVANQAFHKPNWLPNQLIFVGMDRLAHFWPTWGFMSFYQRVGLEGFVKA